MSAVKDALVLARTTLADKRQDVYNEAYNKSKESQQAGFTTFYNEQQEKVTKQKEALDVSFSAAVTAKQSEMETIAKAAAAAATKTIDEEIEHLDESINNS